MVRGSEAALHGRSSEARASCRIHSKERIVVPTSSHPLDGKVAVVSGAARGQGRAHAVRLAREGADIIAVDICADIDTVHYPLARPEDLDETVAQIEQLGRRVAASKTDVRDATAVAAAIDSGVAKLGGLDIVVANAGIAMYDA